MLIIALSNANEVIGPNIKKTVAAGPNSDRRKTARAVALFFLHKLNPSNNLLERIRLVYCTSVGILWVLAILVGQKNS